MFEKAVLLYLTIGALSSHQVSSFLPPTRRVSFLGIRPHHLPFAAPRKSLPRGGSTTRLFAVNFDSDDPFQLLDLEPTADKKLIKRAYKRLALKFHPDVATNQSSSAKEKKEASDKFAKINWAYATLSGKNSDSTTSSSSSSSSSSTSSAGSGYQPPHRRTGSYESTNPYASTDWQDYMPKYDDADYDADGDSFGQIFSDLFTGAAVGAATGGGGGGVFRDFVEFLESNVDGYGGSRSDNDAQLRILLQTGSVQEVGDEMDDTELVVQQLASKLQNIQDDLVMVRADLKQSSARYMEQLDMEERVAELEARETVVKGYVKKARKRLVALQTRYKELIVGGKNDSRAGGGRNSSDSYSFDYGSYAKGSSTSSGSSSSSSRGPSSRGASSRGASSRSSSGSTSSSRESSSTSSNTSSNEGAYKREGFGSSGRGRGSSSRRRAQSSNVQDESARRRTSSSRSTTPPPPPPPRQERTSYSSSTRRSTSSSPSSSPSSSSSSSSVPPHRRTGRTVNREMEDKKRMREMKVDEEFEKLKKDLGL